MALARPSLASLLKGVRRALVMALYAGIGLVALSIVLALLFRFVPVLGTPLMMVRGLEGQEVQSRWVSIDEISPTIVRAVIAAEDTKFCRHHGFDFGELKAAIEDAREGGRLRGASTISQQTAKNVFLFPSRSLLRKGAEAYFTLLIEAAWPKRRIMETYLNIAEWGDGYFGIEAAAQGRFGKSASSLTEREAALLAAVLPNPAEWRVDPPGPYVRRRSGQIAARMAVVGRQELDACVAAAR